MQALAQWQHPVASSKAKARDGDSILTLGRDRVHSSCCRGRSATVHLTSTGNPVPENGGFLVASSETMAEQVRNKKSCSGCSLRMINSGDMFRCSLLNKKCIYLTECYCWFQIT